MGIVDIDIGVRGNRHLHAHQGFHNHEAGSEHRLIIVILVHHGQLVVPAEFDAAPFVGNLQRVVGVEDIGVQRLLVVIYRIPFCKPADIVVGEQLI